MKRLSRSHFALCMLVLALPLLAGCKDETIVGTYTATTFTYASAGSAAKDVLAAGGGITLSIANDYSTGGTMSIPASVTGGSAFSVSLLGDAVQEGDAVTLTLVADSFLRDITFKFDGNSLSGSGTFNGTSVVVVLSK